MELSDLAPIICGIIGGIAGTAVYLKLKKKDGE